MCDWSFEVLGEITMDEGIRSGKSLILGMPEAPQVNIQGLPSNQAWGCPGRHPLFLLTIIGNFTWSYIFIRHMICVNLGASCAFYFSFNNAPCWYEIVLRWFTECFRHFTYIFWVWFYRMLHVLHLYLLKFGLSIDLHIENRHL